MCHSGGITIMLSWPAVPPQASRNPITVRVFFGSRVTLLDHTFGSWKTKHACKNQCQNQYFLLLETRIVRGCFAFAIQDPFIFHSDHWYSPVLPLASCLLNTVQDPVWVHSLQMTKTIGTEQAQGIAALDLRGPLNDPWLSMKNRQNSSTVGLSSAPQLFPDRWWRLIYSARLEQPLNKKLSSKATSNTLRAFDNGSLAEHVWLNLTGTFNVCFPHQKEEGRVLSPDKHDSLLHTQPAVRALQMVR